jgi:hypothetical protein
MYELGDCGVVGWIPVGVCSFVFVGSLGIGLSFLLYLVGGLVEFTAVCLFYYCLAVGY